METTKAKVFIIESGSLDDERVGRAEGKLLVEMLRLVETEVAYRYIRTEKELKVMLSEFAESDYRYLHMSCHGDEDSLGLTLDDVPFERLQKLIPKLSGRRRLFLSACSVANEHLAKALLPKKILSIIGPSEIVNWDAAAVFWASFYHVMLNIDNEQMKNSDIKDTLEKVSALFGVSLKAFFLKGDQAGYTVLDYPGGIETISA